MALFFSCPNSHDTVARNQSDGQCDDCLRACPQITPLRSHPAFGLLLPLLDRKILDAALLRLRFCSILATKSAPRRAGRDPF